MDGPTRYDFFTTCLICYAEHSAKEPAGDKFGCVEWLEGTRGWLHGRAPVMGDVGRSGRPSVDPPRQLLPDRLVDEVVDDALGHHLGTFLTRVELALLGFDGAQSRRERAALRPQLGEACLVRAVTLLDRLLGGVDLSIEVLFLVVRGTGALGGTPRTPL